MPIRVVLILSLVAMLSACERETSSGEGSGSPASSARPSAPGARESNPLENPPIDSARVSSADTAATWGYRKEGTADLNGDGTAERVVVAADAALGPNGAPLWEDGHRWAVYVETPSGKRTLLYGAFVPNGFTEVALLAPDSEGRRRVLVQERTPQQMRVLEVEYLGEGSARESSGAYYQIGEWLPGAASMR
jgi:hypothetical protein